MLLQAAPIANNAADGSARCMTQNRSKRQSETVDNRWLLSANKTFIQGVGRPFSDGRLIE
jgi:hypothetical protein